ncbi:MAG TPA: hypothetical protein VFS39_17450 [Nitrospira sp.]|nr:hypothetical protein [Nitrospira sp.]
MIRVKITIEEIASTWHVTRIAIIDEHFVVHPDTAFASKDDAERDARRRAELYLREHFGGDDGEIQWDVSRVPSSEK